MDSIIQATYNFGVFKILLGNQVVLLGNQVDLERYDITATAYKREKREPPHTLRFRVN